MPNLSFGFPLIKAIRKLSSLPLDVHLMVTNPAFHVNQLIDMGVQWISFHQETEYHCHRLITLIKQHGIKAGIALNPATPLSSLSAILPELDYVLVMSVNPGYSAQAFIPSALDKIEALSKIRAERQLSFCIEVDGGVTADNASSLRKAGADMLVSASYIFSSTSYTEAIKSLRG